MEYNTVLKEILKAYSGERYHFKTVQRFPDKKITLQQTIITPKLKSHYSGEDRVQMDKFTKIWSKWVSLRKRNQILEI